MAGERQSGKKSVEKKAETATEKKPRRNGIKTEKEKNNEGKNTFVYFLCVKTKADGIKPHG